MTDRLHPDEYLPFAPKNKGEQVHVNHDGCPAGRDTKRRLYVKRNEHGKVVAYCHHCGGAGVSSDTVRAYSSGTSLDAVLAVRSGAYESKHIPRQGRARDDKSPAVYRQKTTPSGAALHRVGDWPIAARVWLDSYGIDTSVWRWYYEPRLGRLCYTLRDTEGVAVAKCCRGIEQTNPKYLNFKQESDNPRQFLGTKTECVVITEDIVSAQRCVDAGYAAFPMLTTVVNDRDLLYLTDTFGCAILMLDNDNTDVETKRNNLKSKLELLGCKVISLKETTDPKHYSHTDLVKLLQENTQ